MESPEFMLHIFSVVIKSIRFCIESQRIEFNQFDFLRLAMIAIESLRFLWNRHDVHVIGMILM